MWIRYIGVNKGYQTYRIWKSLHLFNTLYTLKAKASEKAYFSRYFIIVKIRLISYGLRHGKEVKGMNVFYDVRFLNNPYWEKGMRFSTGEDKEVQDFVFRDEGSQEFLEQLKKTLTFNFDHWGKSEEYVVAIACTGGQHRSVSVVEALYEHFKDDYDIKKTHRDLEKAVRKRKSKLIENPNYVPKVVAFGGGSGLSHFIKGLKQFPLDITAIVTVSDDGGSTGELRNLFEMPAPGDIRRVLLSMSKKQELFEELFNFRFSKDLNNDLKGHTIGNMVLAALNEINNKDFVKAVKDLATILDIQGEVIPVSKDMVRLGCEYTDGTIAYGEKDIPNIHKKIKHLFYQNKVKVNKKAIQAVLEADVVIFAPGSLYTSLVANLLFKEMINAIRQTHAKKVFVGNLMTQSETDGLGLNDHITVVEDIIGKDVIDLTIYNNNTDIDPKILRKYRRDGQELVKPEVTMYKAISDDFITISDDKHIRHNARKLGYKIFSYAFELLTSEY